MDLKELNELNCALGKTSSIEIPDEILQNSSLVAQLINKVNIIRDVNRTFVYKNAGIVL